MVSAVAENPSLLYKVFNFLHSFFTSWYVAEIFLIMFILLLLLFMFLIIKDYKLFKYIFNDKIKFIKQYLYFFTIEKVNFLKNFSYILRKEYKKYGVIIIVVLVVALVLGYLLFIVIPDIRPGPSPLS